MKTHAMAALAVGLLAGSCADRCAVPAAPTAHSSARIPFTQDDIERVDLLFSIDNSSSMAGVQARLVRNLGAMIDQLVRPPINPMTMRPLYPPVRSLHVGVVSSDLGTPGSVVPWCAHREAGDDGLFNPIQRGAAMREHPPWRNAPPGRLPARCAGGAGEYPPFLRFDRTTSDAARFRDDVLCNAYLSSGGCDLEQQLEAVYRALIVHDARERRGNTSPNAGFVRDNAVLGIVVVSDEDDGSVRDCRYAERGVPCDDATSVFDPAATRWAAGDLERRFYDYVPGSAQDPTWPLDRYIDPARRDRGFTSLKPGRPDLVLFSAIVGVPVHPPMRASPTGMGMELDWDTLLGRNPDGSDGYVAATPEGPISMRARNVDPACPSRVVPACRTAGSEASAACGDDGAFVALPSRRIAQVARRFQDRYQNGTITSICRDDDGAALRQLVERIQSRLAARCLPRPLETHPAACEPGSGQQGCVLARCVLREVLPAGARAAEVCTSDRGRSPGEPDRQLQRDTCLVRQVAVPPMGPVPPGVVGFYYARWPDPNERECFSDIRFAGDAALSDGAFAWLECLQEQGPAHDAAAPPAAACE